jgi:hypothetical protein
MTLGDKYEKCQGSNLMINHLFFCNLPYCFYLAEKLVGQLCHIYWHLTEASSVIARDLPYKLFYGFRRDTDLNFKLVSVSVTNEHQKIVGQW